MSNPATSSVADVAAKSRSLLPGVILAAVIALAASYLSEHYGGPAMLFALLLGMAFNYLADSPSTAPGIVFSSRNILRIGVALLGARITFSEVESLGWTTVLLVVAGVALTITIGAGLARLLKIPAAYAVLTAGAVAICGASAALAIASVLPKTEESERRTIITVIGVTTLSTIAMMIYPIGVAIAGLSDQAAGIFLGATIHDVAQVIGAGYMISPEAGDTSAIVKLLRVSCLLPAVVAIGLFFRRNGGASTQSAPLLPWFLVAFAIVVALNSFGFLGESLAATLGSVSRWCLLCAVAALGVRTSLGKLTAVGLRPLLAMSLQTAFLAVFTYVSLMYLAR